jgi:hypothetical protein
VRLGQKIFKARLILVLICFILTCLQGQFGAAMEAAELRDPLVWGAVLKASVESFFSLSLLILY